MLAVKPSQLRRNLRLLLCFRAVKDAGIIFPLLVPFFNQNGLNQTQVFWLQAAFSLVMIACEVPTGAIADRYSRKLSLLIGAVVSTAGYLLYGLSHGFWPMLGAEIVLGVGIAFFSGADRALAADSLADAGQPGRFKQFASRSAGLGGMSLAVTAFIGVFLADLVGLRNLMFIQAAVNVLLIPIALCLHEPARTALSPGEAETTLAKVKRNFHRPNVRWLILYGAVMGTSTYTMVWLTQGYYTAVGIPLGLALAVVWFVQQGSQLPFSALAVRYEAWLGRRRSLVSFVLIAVACYVAAAVPSWFGVVAILGFSFIRAVFTPVLEDYVNNQLHSHERATIMSLQSLSMRTLTIVTGPFLGFVFDHSSLTATMLVSAVLYGGLGGIALWRMHRHGLL